jgi:hypothetical protein
MDGALVKQHVVEQCSNTSGRVVQNPALFILRHRSISNMSGTKINPEVLQNKCGWIVGLKDGAIVKVLIGTTEKGTTVGLVTVGRNVEISVGKNDVNGKVDGE